MSENRHPRRETVSERKQILVRRRHRIEHALKTRQIQAAALIVEIDHELITDDIVPARRDENRVRQSRRLVDPLAGILKQRNESLLIFPCQHRCRRLTVQRLIENRWRRRSQRAQLNLGDYAGLLRDGPVIQQRILKPGIADGKEVQGERGQSQRHGMGRPGELGPSCVAGVYSGRALFVHLRRCYAIGLGSLE
jgi:hypothetical protein